MTGEETEEELRLKNLEYQSVILWRRFHLLLRILERKKIITEDEARHVIKQKTT